MELTEITEKINRLSEELEKLRPLKPEDEQRVMQKFRLDWNYNSNNIEGNSLTYGETKALLLFGITAQGKPLKDHLEIEGHNEAIEQIINIAKNKEPLTEAYIRHLHKMILHEPYEIEAITADGQPTRKKVEIGKYKSSPNHVKTITGEIFRFATPEDTPAKMRELMEWYGKNVNSNEIHPLLFAVEFHYRFIRIHPFDDGNGRIVRLLMNLVLMQKGFPPVIIKVKDKENYYRALQQADSGELESFYLYIGEQLISSMELIISAAKGGDVEEEDDVDKEIALLKKELESTDEVKEIKNNSSVEKTLKNLSILFGNNVFPGLKKIEDLYLENSIRVIFLDETSRRRGLPLDKTLKNLPESVKSIIVSIKNLDELNIIYDLAHYKHPKHIFHHQITFIIKFTEYYYHISVDGFELIHPKLYHAHITDEETKKIIKSVKKICVDFIKIQLGKK